MGVPNPFFFSEGAETAPGSSRNCDARLKKGTNQLIKMDVPYLFFLTEDAGSAGQFEKL